ncbi:hypothetical protein HGRIS_005623 [Hohenbuehelia grisea]|uniref:Transmembrane protein n=1 Tax=Hohenbuehelia grisea TaxID=104357 RepID=A0ABR3JXE7_9AGAR
MYLSTFPRDIGPATNDDDTIIPPWAMVAIGVIIYAVIMLGVGIICHHYGCLGSRPQRNRSYQPRQSSSKQSAGLHRESATPSGSPSRRVSQIANSVRQTFVVNTVPPSRRVSGTGIEGVPRRSHTLDSAPPPSRRLSQMAESVGHVVLRTFEVESSPPSRRVSQVAEQSGRHQRQSFVGTPEGPSRRVSQATENAAIPPRRKERPPLVGLTSSETLNMAMLRPPPPAYAPPLPQYRASVIRDVEKENSEADRQRQSVVNSSSE